MPTGNPKTTIDTRTVILKALERDATMEDAAALAGVTRKTVYEWMKQDEAFGDAVNIARASSRDYWRDKLRSLGENGNPAGIIFANKAIGGMKETQVIEHGTADGDDDQWLRDALGDDAKVEEVLANRGNGGNGGNGNGGNPDA